MAKHNLDLIKKQEPLTQAAFDKLFSFLDSDAEKAATKYEDIRQALITFFELRGSPSPLDDTDEAINRVARRLTEGEHIVTEKPVSYFYSVARNIWRETLARPVKTISLSDELPVHQNLMTDPQTLLERAEEERAMEQKLACLELCLQALPTQHRNLIVRYYQGNGSEKIENRRILAEELGVSLSVLRVRACRLREKLESNMNCCLEAKTKRSNRF